MTSKPLRIAIVGAGATGLSAAFDLLAQGHAVTVFEASDKPGGLAAGFRQANWAWSVEKFYHHWFASDAALLKLAEDMGVSGKVMFLRPKTVSYYKGGFLQLDSPLSALLFRGLSIFDKIPFGLAGVYLKATSNWKQLEQYTAHDWLTRWMGKGAYELLFEPLLVGKFGEYARQVNAAWFWARIKYRTTRLGTYEGGFQAFFDDLAARVTERGGRIVYRAPVSQLQRDDATGTWTVTANGASGSFDRVLSTLSPGAMARLAPQLPADYLGALLKLRSLGAVVAVFTLNHPLSEQGNYWHNLPKSAGFPYLAMCEHTNFVSAEHFGGQRIVYCGDYLPTDHAYFSMTDAEIRAAFTPSFKRFNPGFDEAWIDDVFVFREKYAQPVPFVNHSRNIPDVKTPLAGLWFASMSHVYPYDRGTNYAVALGRDVAMRLTRE